MRIDRYAGEDGTKLAALARLIGTPPVNSGLRLKLDIGGANNRRKAGKIVENTASADGDSC